MVAIPSGRYFLSFLIILCVPSESWEINGRGNCQGGAFALLRRLSSFVDEQLVMPSTGGHSTIDTPHRSIESLSEGEGRAGTSSQVDNSCHFR